MDIMCVLNNSFNATFMLLLLVLLLPLLLQYNSIIFIYANAGAFLLFLFVNQISAVAIYYTHKKKSYQDNRLL